MVKPKFKLNLFDIIFVILMLLVVVVVAVSWNNQPYLGTKNVIVTVKIDDGETINNISSQLSQNKQVCIDSSHYCGTQIQSEAFIPEGTGVKSASIKIKGLGYTDGDRLIFLGHRIYANQEVQLRGNYAAIGRITDFYYEEN